MQAQGRQGTGQRGLLCSQKVQDGQSQTGKFLLLVFRIFFLKTTRLVMCVLCRVYSVHFVVSFSSHRFVATTCFLKWIPRTPSPFVTLPALWEMLDFWPRWTPTFRTIYWKCLNRRTSLNFPVSRLDCAQEFCQY